MHINIVALTQIHVPHMGKVLKLSAGTRAIAALQWEFTVGRHLGFKEKHLIQVKQAL